MQHRSALILLLLVTALVGFSPKRTASAQTVQYPPGWNLVSGPAGSRLHGAVGSLYSLGRYDADYKQTPAGAELAGCAGYWAYFPTGGDIMFSSEGAGTCAVNPGGQFVMLGNNDATKTATIVGAELAYIYVPGSGYQITSTIAPGQGVWVLSSMDVTLDFR